MLVSSLYTVTVAMIELKILASPGRFDIVQSHLRFAQFCCKSEVLRTTGRLFDKSYLNSNSAKLHPAPFWFFSHFLNVLNDLRMTSFSTFFSHQDICSLSPTSPPASCSSISWSREVAPPRAFRPTDNRDSIFFPCHDLHFLNITRGVSLSELTPRLAS